MNELSKKTLIVIKVTEYDLLLKKAELYDKLISKEKVIQEGGSLAQIVANQAYNEGLLKPLNTNSTKLINKFINKGYFFVSFKNVNLKKVIV